MANALEIRGLTKTFPGFSLEDLNLALPQGNIMGFIGENGAGKSTTIRLILNLLQRDRGQIEVFSLDNRKNEQRIKENIGVVHDENCFPETLHPAAINSVMGRVYKNWDSKLFYSHLEKFELPCKKEIKAFSRGMKMKLAIAVALSHQAKLLILDEPTSGLDPIIRDEILDIFLDFIQNEERAVFLSTHLTGDIEKIADYVAFIHRGRLIFVEPKDELLDTYGVLKCTSAEWERLDPTWVKGYRRNKFGVEALVIKSKYKNGYLMDKASIEDIMLFTVRGQLLCQD